VGSKEIVQIFLDANVPLSGEPSGPSPLMMAAWSGHDDVVNQLLAAGAAPDTGGDVSLLEAAWSAAESLPSGRYQKLAEAGALDVVLDADGFLSDDGDESSGATPLMGAVVGGHRTTVVTLLDAGADSNRRAGGTISVLWIAVAMGDAEIVSALRFAGADPDPQATGADDAVESPLALARALGDQELIDLLQ
jgi:ankyrin repeat protein